MARRPSDGIWNLAVIGDDSALRKTLMESLTGKKDFRLDLHELQCKYGNITVSIGVWDAEDIYNLHLLYTRHPKYNPKVSDLHGYMIVYNVEDTSSFEKATSYYAETMEYNSVDSEILSYDKPPKKQVTQVTLVGMLYGTTYKRRVTVEQGLKKARELHMGFTELDVGNREVVKQTFVRLTEESFDNQREALTYGISYSLLKKLKSASNSVNDILQHGVEENHHIRVMIVGKAGVGKTTLTRRLIQLPVNIRQYNSTDGIDVHIHTCEVNLESGEWSQRSESFFQKVKAMLGILPKEENSRRTHANARDFHHRLAKVVLSHDEQRKSRRKRRDNEISFKQTPFKPAVPLPAEKQASTGTWEEDEKTFSDNVNVSMAFHHSVTADDIDKLLHSAKMLKSTGHERKAKISFYDFAGQDIFHASHPTFLSSKAIYILVFNLKNISQWKTKGSSVTTSDLTRETDSDEESVIFWLNVIYMFESTKQIVQPHVLLVGTHADELPSKDRETIIQQLFDRFRDSIVDSPFNRILLETEYAVDNTNGNNPVYTELKADIFETAKSLPTWGEKTPSKWLPLEREIQNLKDDGRKVIALKQLRGINMDLEVGVSSDEELTIFLQFLHDTGEIIYFSEEGLRDTIVLDPIWMIDALKTIITARQFVIRKPAPVNVQWNKVYESGIISKTAIECIFDNNKKDRSLFENCEHVIRLMEKFLFIAAPVAFTGEMADTSCVGEEQMDINYIMPCMVKKKADTDLITIKEGKSSTTVMCMIPASNFLPPAVFHKILAMCITKWPVVEQCGHKQIFPGICKFNIDKQRLYKLTVYQVKYAVHVRIDSFIDELRPDTEICQPVMEFLTYSMKSVLQAMGFSDEFQTCIQCPQYSAANPGGYLDIELMKSQSHIACDYCHSSHSLETKEILGCWLEMVFNEEEDPLTRLCGDSMLADASHYNDHSAESVRVELDEPEDVTQEEDNPDTENGPITQEHLNHARLCNVLVKVCADGLREILLDQLPQGCPDFHHLLVSKEVQLRRMKQLRQEQLGILYPDPQNQYTGTVDQFDITLLCSLIWNISAVVPPRTGWGQQPNDNPRDTSLGANVERIRCFRNVVSHSVDYKVDEQTFEDTWKEISQTMDDIENVIGEKEYTTAMREIKTQTFTLKQGKLLQKKFKDDISTVVEDVDHMMTVFGDLGGQIKKKLTAIVEDT